MTADCYEIKIVFSSSTRDSYVLNCLNETEPNYKQLTLIDKIFHF